MPTSFHQANIPEFQKLTQELRLPLALHAPPALSSPPFLPAQEKWFTPSKDPSGANSGTLSPYLDDFFYLPFPYELMSPQPLAADQSGAQDAVSLFVDWLSRQTSPREALLMESILPLKQELLRPPTSAPSFFQFDAPLSLLLSALAFNRSSPNTPLRQLYIAQSPIPDLPPQLAADLPTPHIVAKAGKGDIYASSIWIGLEPTYTPLHRDPNPNLFCQLHGAKVVRLMSPTAGEALFRTVQRKLGKSGSSRIRLADMMHGPERDLLHTTIWDATGEDTAGELLETRVGPGDALFIPVGWWHSVRSDGWEGALNASVNWWFR